MKTKKYVIAIALFGGMLFTVLAANAYNLDGATTAKIEKKPMPILA